LDGADQLLPAITADTVIADIGYDADARFIEALEQAGKTAWFRRNVTVRIPAGMTSTYTRHVT